MPGMLARYMQSDIGYDIGQAAGEVALLLDVEDWAGDVDDGHGGSLS